MFLAAPNGVGRLIEGLCNLELDLFLTIVAKKYYEMGCSLFLLLGGSGGMQSSVSRLGETSLDVTAPPHVICWILRIWMRNDGEKRWLSSIQGTSGRKSSL